MRRKLAWLAAVACVAWLVPAWALSLGGIRVHSQLNQPLTASIPIYPAAGEAVDENVKIKLASSEDYARAGLERADFLSDLSFTVEPDRVVVSSTRAVREPVVDLLIEVKWSGGRLLRQYTLLLDPEGVGSAPPPLEPSHVAATTPETAGQATRAQGGGSGNVGGTRNPSRSGSPAETPPLTPRASSSSPPSTITAESPSGKAVARSYGPVRVNETPLSVAAKLKPDPSITTEQVVIALFQWNPTAFTGNLSAFKPGSVLRVPDAEVMRRVDPQMAKARIADARARSEQAVANANPSSAPSAEPAPAMTPSKAMPAPETNPEAAPKSPAVAPETAPAAAPSAAATTPSTPSTTPETAPGAASSAAPPAQEAPPAAAPAPAPVEPEHKREESGGWMIWAGVGLGVLIVGLLVWRLSRRPKSPGDDFAMDQGSTLASTPSPRPAAAARAPEPEPAPMAEEEPEPAHAQTMPEPEISEPPPQRVTITEPAPAPAAQKPAPAPAAAKPAPKPTQTASFSDTALTDTRQIDLEGGDALAEADFHLAYGLYDEAILLLTQALIRDPHRTDVRTKLAEAYFSANRGQEFLDTAKALKGQLDAAGWEKIAVLGRQLFPSDPLFGGAGKAPPAPAAAPSGNTIAFDMPAAAPKPAAAPEPAAPKPAESAPIAFELGSLDLDTPVDAGGAASAAGGAGLDLDSHVGIDDTGAGGGDEASTKLDLARAYIDLGDNDMARGLLTEVVQQGTADQKAAAEELMRTLPA